MKKLSELKTDELKQVFYKNEKLQQELFDAALDDSLFWINEYFNYFKNGAIDYNIGYPGNYLSIKNTFDFIDGLEGLQNDFCLFNDDDAKKIIYAGELIKKHDNIYCYDCINLERIENRIDELAHNLKNIFFKKIIDEYNYYFDNNNLLEYFTSFYIDNLDDNYYIDNDFILYQHIEYEKKYA